eukprot:TRINITY_DN69_c0_g1_i1.p1 TRINITY_DN69_c0_g1~~TRINITY_DN69_c0_g1_i1.p1  ORF type:complete len:324 (+),score=86.37 TRINITY_DN69_c0_g1_i1:90-1061(+)
MSEVSDSKSSPPASVRGRAKERTDGNLTERSRRVVNAKRRMVEFHELLKTVRRLKFLYFMDFGDAMNTVATPEVSDSESLSSERESGTEGSDAESNGSVSEGDGANGKAEGSRSVHFDKGVHVYQETSETSEHSRKDGTNEDERGEKELEEETQARSGVGESSEEGLGRDPYAHRRYVYSLLRDTTASYEPKVAVETPKVKKYSPSAEGSAPQSAPSGRRLESVGGRVPSSASRHHSRYEHLHRFTYSLQHSDGEKRTPRTTPRRPHVREKTRVKKDARHQQMEQLLRNTPKRTPKGTSQRTSRSKEDEAKEEIEETTPWWKK